MSYTCDTRAHTLEWLEAIARLLSQYRFLWTAHVVDFFKGKLWESVDKDWMDCLKEESVADLLHLPCGLIKDNWPASLKELLYSVQSLSFPRDSRKSLQMYFSGLSTPSIGKVLSQGMNSKKKHEVEILASVIQRIANKSGAHCIIDVGAGQGYLAHVLSFEYQFPVIALDASLHHATVTNKRAERIRKHYQARMQNFHMGSLDKAGHEHLFSPQTVTSHVLGSESLVSLSNELSSSFSTMLKDCGKKSVAEYSTSGPEVPSPRNIVTTTKREQTVPCDIHKRKTSLVLAGLHACGDLSVAMLRTFLECKEVKAVVSIGCCYNLLSEEGYENKPCYGFPMSKGVENLGIHLGRNGRDLACQSAERWRNLTVEDAEENFDVHAFRAAFQILLENFFPDVSELNPTVGRLGKARRRQKTKHSRSQFSDTGTISSALVDCNVPCSNTGLVEVSKSENGLSPVNIRELMVEDAGNSTELLSSFKDMENEVEKSVLFEEYSACALERLGLSAVPVKEVVKVWKEVEYNVGLIGPYWSLRAVFGPLLETFLLLDRFLFLQEENVAEVMMLPLFNPYISPRNIAIIAQKE